MLHSCLAPAQHVCSCVRVSWRPTVRARAWPAARTRQFIIDGQPCFCRAPRYMLSEESLLLAACVLPFSLVLPIMCGRSLHELRSHRARRGCRIVVNDTLTHDSCGNCLQSGGQTRHSSAQTVNGLYFFLPAGAGEGEEEEGRRR